MTSHISKHLDNLEKYLPDCINFGGNYLDLKYPKYELAQIRYGIEKLEGALRLISTEAYKMEFLGFANYDQVTKIAREALSLEEKK